MHPQRWLCVGHSIAPGARQGGAEAAAAAAAGGDDIKLLVVFASAAYDFAELLAGIRDAAGEVPLVGCSTAGEIATDHVGEASVVVTALGGPGLDVATASACAQSEDAMRAAGADAAACVRAVERRRHRVLLLLSDGLYGDQQEVIRGAYSVAGPSVPLVGGCAGDDLKMVRTYQFHDGRVLSESVVAAALASDAPFGIGVRHGWTKVGDPLVVTRSTANRVEEIEDRPAVDVYLELLDAPAEAWSSPEAFTEFALTHPLALSTRVGEDEMRFISGADFDTRALQCVAEVPQGGVVWLSEGDDASLLDATDGACLDALAALDGGDPAGLLAFDCIARRSVLGGPGIQRELDRIGRQANGAPVAGFYTYGEIARTRGVNGFHNQTLVVLAIG